ncbi:MAG TPA: c-type cytochrome [Myxococcota bacterium]|nr:c-type cytochrome [Myxococcota bacterium]
MKHAKTTAVLLGATSVLAAGAWAAEDPFWGQATAERGRIVYRANCVGCHGDEGDGQGPAADTMFPAPRDLTAAEYRFRSTPTGALPTRDDLLRTLELGLPGTEMPAWGRLLDPVELRSVVLYLETLSPRFEQGPQTATIVPGVPPEVTPELLARGSEIYVELKCGVCHGPEGRGDGKAAAGLADEGEPSPVFDFTFGVYKGGNTPEDVYRTFMTGLNGTPMPSYAASIPDETDRWALVHYVRSLTRPRGLGFYLGNRVTWRDPLGPYATRVGLAVETPVEDEIPEW